MANLSANITPLSTFFADNENKSEAFGKFVKYIHDVCLAYGIDNVIRKKAMLMVQGGEELAMLEIPDFVPTEAQGAEYVETYAELATRIAAFYPARPTPYLNDFKLHSLKQLDGEVIRDYANRLLKVARKCTFTEGATALAQQQQAVISCLVIGTSNKKLQQQILNLNLATTLQNVLEMGATLESVAAQQSQISNALSSNSIVISRVETSTGRSCSKCGNVHKSDYCPAQGVECYNCHNKGHFSRYCFKPRKEKQNVNVSAPTRRGSTGSTGSTSIVPNSNSNKSQYGSRPGYLNKNNRSQQRQISSNDSYDYQNEQATLDMPPPSITTSQSNDQLFSDYFSSGLYTKQCMLKVVGDTSSCKPATCVYEIDGHQVYGLLDTGAGSSTQNTSSYDSMNPKPPLLEYKGKAYSFGSTQEIEVRGCYFATITCNKFNTLSHVTCILVCDAGDNVLDNNTCQVLNLVIIVNKLTVEQPSPSDTPPPTNLSQQSTQQQNNELKNGYGSLLKYINQSQYASTCKAKFTKLFKAGAIGKYIKEVKLSINYNIEPTKCKHDRTPIYLRPVVSAETAENIRLDLVEKLPPDTPTTWVVPIRVVPKKGGTGWRVTLNMIKPNQAIMRTQHVMLTMDDLRIKIAGAKWLTKFDLNKAYQQLVVREEDRHMMTFSTFEGLFRSKRLLFGVSSASEIFDNAVSETLAHIPNAVNLSDDVLCWGSDDSHDTTADDTMQAMQDAGFTFNGEKCVFKQTAQVFFNRVISGYGIQPTEESIRALRDSPRPKTASEVKSFLGVVNWHTTFIPSLAELAEPLHTMARARIFKWTDEHDNTFKQLKYSLTNKPLKHFNKNWYTKLYVDAGPKGLGAILVQIDPQTGEIHVCFYGSKMCTDVEERYSQIEREFLACKWGLLKYKFYLKNKRFTLVTDNKPVKQMLENPNAAITNERIQRMFDKIPKYDFSVEYIKGTENPADFLSRNPVVETIQERIINNKMCKSIEAKVLQIVIDAAPPILSLKLIKTETEKCKILQEVIAHVTNGTPQNQMSPIVKPFQEILEQLMIFDGIISIENKIVIPASLQTMIIKHAHIGHQGVTKTTNLLKLHAWFPRLKALVEQLVKSCICQIHSAKIIRLPVHMTEMPLGPMKTLCFDYKGPLQDGKLLLVKMCMYSRYPFVTEVSSTSYIQMERAMINVFTVFGFPTKIVSDGGPPFNSNDLKCFCAKHSIEHHVVTPLWPNANGMAENFIKGLVKLIEVCNAENKNLHKELNAFLLNYRATPHSVTGISPAKLMFGREIQTTLPQLNSKYEGNQSTNELAELTNKYNTAKIKTYADAAKHVVQNHAILKDDIVRIVIKLSAFKSKQKFDPELFKVIEVRGSAIAVESTVDKRTYVRNCNLVNLVSKSKQHTNKTECTAQTTHPQQKHETTIIKQTEHDSKTTNSMFSSNQKQSMNAKFVLKMPVPKCDIPIAPILPTPPPTPLFNPPAFAMLIVANAVNNILQINNLPQQYGNNIDDEEVIDLNMSQISSSSEQSSTSSSSSSSTTSNNDETYESPLDSPTQSSRQTKSPTKVNKTNKKSSKATNLLRRSKSQTNSSEPNGDVVSSSDENEQQPRRGTRVRNPPATLSVKQFTNSKQSY